MSESKYLQLKEARLRIISDSARGKDTRVFLNDVDISYMLTGVGFAAAVSDVCHVKLSLIVGHIDIDVPIGTLELNAKGIAIHRAKRLRRFLNRAKNAIAKRFRFLRLSARVDIAETTAFGDKARKYIPRNQPHLSSSEEPGSGIQKPVLPNRGKSVEMHRPVVRRGAAKPGRGKPGTE